MLLAWIDGQLLPATEATVSAYDLGFRSGAGVFETFRAYGEHVFRLQAHLRRAVEGAGQLGFEIDGRQRLAEAVTATCSANLEALEHRDSALRLVVTPGPIDPAGPFPGRPVGRPTVAVTSHRLLERPAIYREGIAVVTVPSTRPLPQVKSVSYVAATQARRRAREAGAEEALLARADGRVLEGASSNVFAVVDGRLITPPVEAGILAGVTRGVVLEVAARTDIEVEEDTLHADELTAADEVLITSTTREVVPVVAVDGHPVGTGEPGPVAARLLEGYRRVVDRERG